MQPLTGEVNVATGQDEPVMASTEGNVKTNAGILIVPDKALGELATSIAWPELTLAISGRKLDIEAEFLQTAEIMAGNELSRAWSTASAILLEVDLTDIEEATITTTGAADDDGANGDEVKKKKASRQAFEGRKWLGHA